MSDIPSISPTDWSTFGQGQQQLSMEQQRTNAATALTQQQTAAAGMQNQITAASMPAIMQVLQGYSQSANETGSPQQGGAGNEPAQPTPEPTGADGSAVADQPADPKNPIPWDQAQNGITQQYTTAAAGLPTPQENLQLRRAQILKGNPQTAGIGAAMESQVNYGIKSRQIGANQDALQKYQTLAATSNAPAGQAIDVLANSGPYGKAMAAYIKNKFPDPQDQDTAARAAAEHLAPAYHVFSGHGRVKGDDGIWRDDQTTQPIVGGSDVGMAPDQRRQLVQHWADPYGPGVPDGMGGTVHPPLWQASGMLGGPKYASAQDAADKNSGSPNVPQQLASPAAQMNPQQAATRQRMAAAVDSRSSPAANAAASATGTANIPAGVTDPVERKALADPQYNIMNSPDVASQYQFGKEPNTLLKGTLADIDKTKSSLFTQSSEAVRQGAAAKTYLDAAQAALDSSDWSPVGSGSGVQSLVNNWLASHGLAKGDYAAHHYEIAKYLSQYAWGAIKQTLPPGSRLNQMEFNAAMNTMNPSVAQNEEGLRDLINKSRAVNQYTMDSGNRAINFLRANKDPRAFEKYNQENWNESNIINAPAQTSQPQGKWSPAQVTKYAQTHFGGDETKARAWLANPKQ